MLAVISDPAALDAAGAADPGALDAAEVLPVAADPAALDAVLTVAADPAALDAAVGPAALGFEEEHPATASTAAPTAAITAVRFRFKNFIVILPGDGWGRTAGPRLPGCCVEHTRLLTGKATVWRKISVTSRSRSRPAVSRSRADRPGRTGEGNH